MPRERHNKFICRPVSIEQAAQPRPTTYTEEESCPRERCQNARPSAKTTKRKTTRMISKSQISRYEWASRKLLISHMVLARHGACTGMLVCVTRVVYEHAHDTRTYSTSVRWIFLLYTVLYRELLPYVRSRPDLFIVDPHNAHYSSRLYLVCVFRKMPLSGALNSTRSCRSRVAGWCPAT